MKKLKIGVIGLGSRGGSMIQDILLPLCETEIEIAALCDVYADRVEKSAALVEEVCGKRPMCCTDYHDVLAQKDIDAVHIMTSWGTHIDIAVAAMRAGKYVGMEVGGAYEEYDCWRLVETAEATGNRFMLLENCCYDKRELMALRMMREGVFGEVVHCAGGYHHDLRSEILYGERNRHYRFCDYIHRNCENYPTHELGPIAKILDINNGNRFLSLTSTASCAKGLHAYAVAKEGSDSALAQQQFAQGDIVTTVIKCENGQTVTLTLDTTLPRSYSRGFTVRGTAGSYFGDTDMFCIEGKGKMNGADCEEAYLHPLWKDYVPKGGHGGIDWIVMEAFFDAVREQKRAPIDVYDAAAWMSITALSAKSIAMGSAPVAIPDFTRGRYLSRQDIGNTVYDLDAMPRKLDF